MSTWSPLEFRSLLDRVSRTHDYEACPLALAEADADPNVDMNVWLSSGGTHLWSPQQKSPATAWEASGVPGRAGIGFIRGRCLERLKKILEAKEF